MNCVICKSQQVEKKLIEEEIRIGNDVVFVPIEVLMCKQCGEKYYDRATIRKLEKVERDIVDQKVQLKEIGHVLKAA